MNKFTLVLHSRTFWTLIAMIINNILAVYGKLLNPDLTTLINLILTGLVAYFHVNPSQNYTTPPIPPQA